MPEHKYIPEIPFRPYYAPQIDAELLHNFLTRLGWVRHSPTSTRWDHEFHGKERSVPEALALSINDATLLLEKMFSN